MSSKAEVAAQAEAEAKSAATSTRDRLITVGVELMRKRGFGATGLQEILDAAEVPKGSFYHYFRSKEEFASAVIERYAAVEGEHCRAVFGNTRKSPLKRLRRYFEDLIETAGQSAPIQGCLMGALSLEVANVSALLQSSLSRNFSQWQAGVAAVLQEAIDKGDLPKSARAQALAGFLLNSWEGALLRSQADRSDAPLMDFLHYVFEELLRRR